LAVASNDPWHSARANVSAREGTYYYEARIISGIVRGSQLPGVSPRGNVRLGFARREADLDVNVGVDCYGYGIRDVNGEVVNRMRCEYFFPKDEAIYEGDVIGMLITLPPLALHKKIVDGTYDTAVDGDGSNVSESAASVPMPINFIRDRIPFHLKSDFLYQQSHIFPTKHLRDYAFNLKETPTYGPPSPGNSEDPSLRTLPGSSITIYKNGVRMGSPFTNLYAFLPPASRATQGSNNLGIGERENADDGMIGYFPAVSCHCGGAVECRFEAPWWVGPPVQDFPHVKPFGDRFVDQIIEDIVADIVDEVDATFAGWNLDANGVLGTSTTAIATRDPVSGVGAGVEDGGSISVVGTPHAGSQIGGPGERGVSEDVEMGL
jgi:COMPASS component BRE2